MTRSGQPLRTTLLGLLSTVALGCAAAEDFGDDELEVAEVTQQLAANPFAESGSWHFIGYRCGSAKSPFQPLNNNRAYVHSGLFVNEFGAATARKGVVATIGEVTSASFTLRSTGNRWATSGPTECSLDVARGNCTVLQSTQTYLVQKDLVDTTGTRWRLTNSAGHALCPGTPFIIEAVRTTDQTRGTCSDRYELWQRPLDAEQKACMQQLAKGAGIVGPDSFLWQRDVPFAAASLLECKREIDIAEWANCLFVWSEPGLCEIPWERTVYNNARLRYIQNGQVTHDSGYFNTTCFGVVLGSGFFR